MKKVYLVSIEDLAEGMFDDKGKLIDYWHANDADWRIEYFSGFMEWAGIEVIVSRDIKLERKLRKLLDE